MTDYAVEDGRISFSFTTEGGELHIVNGPFDGDNPAAYVTAWIQRCNEFEAWLSQLSQEQ